jgi:hypothetical protein
MKIRLLGFALLLVLGAAARPAAAQGLATYRLGPGWATFGLALPAGSARDGVQVGTLPTQTDVKTTWPDGSIRFAVVTVRVTTEGDYRITAASRSASRIDPPVPSAAVRLVIDGQGWDAVLPALLGDPWLSGPLVSERRAIVAPARAGAAHPFLRVVFDVRSYSDGGQRLDVTVENTLDVSSADAVFYDVTVALGGLVVFQQNRVSHAYMTRWRRVFASGTIEASVVPDIEPFVRARAVPRYLATIASPSRAVDGDRFGILQVGDLHQPMNDHGGRPELAPYPDWTAQYLVHRRADQRAYVLKHGDLAGAWAVHIKEPDGVRLVSIDDHPDFWLDTRAGAAGRPKNNLRGIGPRADNAHQPSLAFVPYLVTGDRYYLDELKYWANFCLISTFQDSSYNSRGGSRGLLDSNEVRGFGWALRTIADAAAYLPDADPFRRYFAEKLQNNLAWLDAYSGRFQAPLGSLFADPDMHDDASPPHAMIAVWQQSYLAWAVDHANGHGFAGGTSLRDRIARFQLRLFTSGDEGYPRAYAAPYLLAIGTVRNGAVSYFSSFREIFHATYGGAGKEAVAFPRAYGVEARLMLLIAQARDWPGVSDALSFLMSSVAPDGFSMRDDLNARSGWAIDAGAAPQPASPAIALYNRK